jgi:hypothetical protein
MREACVMRLKNEKYTHTKFWSENLKGRDHLTGLDVDGRIV